MEESEKRRERLKALRTEAEQAQVSNIQHASTPPGSLTNPLLDAYISPSPAENSPAVPRFDFYTDPMSAFTGNKRWNRDNIRNPHDYSSPPISGCSSVGQLPTPHSGPRNLNASPVAAHQFQMNYTPERAYQAPPSHIHAPWRSPIRMVSPFPGHTGTPTTWNQSGGSPRFGFPPYSPRGGFSSPGYGRRGSSSPNTGRGSFNRVTRSPGTGQSSVRGRGFHISALDHPERFYHKSMMEDPWRFLKPIVRSLAATPKNPNADSSRSWLPKSISTKKARVSEPSVEFNSKSSLADCLSLSLEEAVEDAANI